MEVKCQTSNQHTEFLLSEDILSVTEKLGSHVVHQQKQSGSKIWNESGSNLESKSGSNLISRRQKNSSQAGTTEEEYVQLSLGLSVLNRTNNSSAMIFLLVVAHLHIHRYPSFNVQKLYISFKLNRPESASQS